MDCPHDFHAIAPNSQREIDVVPLAGAITDVVGYHDCQRLVIDDGKSYGPLVAVFASARLGSLEGDLASAGTGLAIAAAEIYSYDGPYDPLGIEPGFNCLYVWHAETWQAKMVPVGYDEGACLESLPFSDPRGKQLQVRVDRESDMAQSDYPPVAKWDWDAINMTQYIGLACGAAWCEIGEAGFQPSAPVAFANIASTRVSRVKGWFDEQALAVTGPDGLLHPSAVRGVLFPTLDLAEQNDPAVFHARWVQVATAVLDGPLPQYKEKLNYDAGANLIFLCNGTRAECIPSDASQPACTGEGSWWGKIVSTTGEIRYSCVAYKDHAGLDVPGTVRWRWMVDDETNWIRCPTGCCELKP
jgi:hypothetical protein